MAGIKLFGKYAYDELDKSSFDKSLCDYLSVHEPHRVVVPHTAGRYTHKRFQKVSCPLVERFANHLMGRGRNTGKKLLAIKIVEQAFDIINLTTNKNPLITFVKAVENSGAREDTTRIGVGGSARRQACDVSPLRRVDQALATIILCVRKKAFRSSSSLPECLADELIKASENSPESGAVAKKNDTERNAKANR